MRGRGWRLGAALLLLGVTASCAYYNTFYLARKYYMRATDGQPYEVDRENTTQRLNYNKSADYAKKLLGVYPRSKLVDDAWLMWARTLVGTDDPLKAVTMLQEFETRFPKSDLRPDAEFFLGLAFRAARKHEQAVDAFGEFLAQAPKHPLVPYAYYERSKAYMSLRRFRESAESAGEVLKRYPKHVLADRALRQRAEARFQQQDWAGARTDFHEIGARAFTDEERLKLLLREVDCLESGRAYDEARALLRDARSHVPPPPPLPTEPRVGLTPGAPAPPPPTVVRTPAEEQYGRLTLRMGGVELLAGRVDAAVDHYRAVLHDFPRSQLSAEAQYRIGYAYETGADDFTHARTEYARVREQTGSSQFAQQAQARLENLDRIDRFRTAGGADSLVRKAEARFLVAEHYLFNLERPERAVEEYRAIFDSISIPSVRARALNAEAWVLSRKLERKAAADSVFWRVVREFPATEAQLAARDYLEEDGQAVPESLIVAPREISAPVLDPAEELVKPSGGTPRLGDRGPGVVVDPGAVEYGPGTRSPAAQMGSAAPLGNPAQWRGRSLSDSLRQALSTRDSLVRIARSDTSAAGRARVDSLRRSFLRPDTLGRGALMARIAQQVSRAESVVVAPGQGTPPDLSKGDSLAGAVTAPPGRPRPAAWPAVPRVEMPDSSMGRVRTDSTHKSALSPKRVFARRDSASTARATGRDSVRAGLAPTPAPVVRDSLRQANAKRDSLRRFAARRDSLLRAANPDSVRRAAAKRDSVRRVIAKRDSLRRAAAAADSLSRRMTPASAPPPAGRVAADSTRGRQR